jgi:methyl-accepting chemotaxis protein
MSTQEPQSAANAADVLRGLAALKDGDFSVRLAEGQPGVDGEIARAFNLVLARLGELHYEYGRIFHEMGIESKFGGQAELAGLGGAWHELTVGVNTMSANITTQIRGVTRALEALAIGDLTKTLTVEARGEMSNLCVTVDKLAHRLRNQSG